MNSPTRPQGISGLLVATVVLFALLLGIGLASLPYLKDQARMRNEAAARTPASAVTTAAKPSPAPAAAPSPPTPAAQPSGTGTPAPVPATPAKASRREPVTTGGPALVTLTGKLAAAESGRPHDTLVFTRKVGGGKVEIPVDPASFARASIGSVHPLLDENGIAQVPPYNSLMTAAKDSRGMVFVGIAMLCLGVFLAYIFKRIRETAIRAAHSPETL